MGRRSAYQRIAHLLCETGWRLQAVGRGTGSCFALPLTQAEIGDAMGLSTVHVNRTLQQLRADGLIATQGQAITILDGERLRSAGEFTPQYLYLGSGGNRGAQPAVR